MEHESLKGGEETTSDVSQSHPLRQSPEDGEPLSDHGKSEQDGDMVGADPKMEASQPRQESAESTEVEVKDETTAHAVVSHRVIKTIACFLATCALSMTTYSFGPSLLNLESLFDTTIKALGISIMCTSIGYMIGSALAAVLVNRVPHELLYGVCQVFAGLCLVFCTLPEDVYFFSGALFVRGIFSGIMDAGVQSHIVMMWSGTRFRGPVLLGLHCVFYGGVFLGPLIMRPFLVDLADAQCQEDVLSNNNNNNSSNAIVTLENVTSVYETYDLSMSTDSSMLHQNEDCNPYMVKFGYVTLGCVVFASGCLLNALYLYERLSPKQEDAVEEGNGKKNNTPCAQSKVSKSFRRQMLFIHFTLMVCWNCLWEVLAAMCAVFVTKELGWDTTRAALITSCLGFAAMGGLITAVPIAAVLSPRQMLLGAVGLSTVAMLIMCVFVHSGNGVMWATMLLTGAAGSTVDASATLYLAGHVVFDGVAAAIGMLGMSMAAVIGVPVAAYLFEVVSYMWVIYLSFIGGVASIVTIIIWFVVVYFHSKRQREREHSPEIDQLKPLKVKNGDTPEVDNTQETAA